MAKNDENENSVHLPVNAYAKLVGAASLQPLSLSSKEKGGPMFDLYFFLLMATYFSRDNNVVPHSILGDPEDFMEFHHQRVCS